MMMCSIIFTNPLIVSTDVTSRCAIAEINSVLDLKYAGEAVLQLRCGAPSTDDVDALVLLCDGKPITVQIKKVHK